MNSFIDELKIDCESWNDNSLEPVIFAKLIQDCGLSESVINQVLIILKSSLDPSKEPQLRTRFLLLIPEIFSSSSNKTAVSKELSIDKNTIYLETCLEQIINDMIVPNIVWKAGRSASAVRMTAIASLALIMQEDAVKNINVSNLIIIVIIKNLIPN